MSHVIGVHYFACQLILSLFSSVRVLKFIEEFSSVLQKLYGFCPFLPRNMTIEACC